ncbi:hypothetical protein [Pantoea agglomerans]|uniref:hypothetical protein n=1 Tax=Enterobacter agglomerans TaxID=549 RepID=UPI001654561E|nr:hypothetical protein [Pantoea agglomerans]
MKREDVNTIIAISGLILAAYGNYKQFKPEKDKLEMVVSTGFLDDSEVRLNNDVSAARAIYGDGVRLAGPISIKLEISNNMSRAVTIKKIEVELIKDDALIDYSGMFSPLDKKTMDNLFDPTTIAEHSVKNIELRINIPIHYSEKVSSCFSSIKSSKIKNEQFGDVRFCYYKKGVDLLGNKVKLKQFEGGAYMVESSKAKSLNYRVTAITGDNSEMVSIATFN